MKPAGFPPIKTLFQDSWQAMVKSLLNLFILTLIGGGMWLVLMIGLFVGTMGIGFISSLAESNQEMNQAMTKYLSQIDPAALPKYLSIAGIGFGVFVLVSVILASVTSVAIVYAIAKYQEKPSLGQCFSQGLKLFIPVTLVGLLGFFISFGGWFLFLIPGLLMAVFFSFAKMEVILGGRRFLGAIKSSVRIVAQNFGDVFGRTVLFWFLHWTLSYIIGRALPFLSFFYMFFIFWFESAYTVVLYQQAKAVTNESDKPKLSWVWVTSFLGWVTIGFLIWGSVNYIKTPAAQAQIAGFKQELLGGKKTEAEIIEDYLNSINDEARPYWDQSVELFKQIQAVSNNPTEVKKLNDQNIAALKKATELDPKNPELWSGLCSAQTWVSTAGSLDDGLKACGKADELAPGMIKYAYNFGDMLMRLGKYEEAVIELEKVLKINDNYGWGHYSLGLAYKNLRMQDSAKEHLQKAIDIWNGINNDGEWGEEILQARKELETVGR